MTSAGFLVTLIALITQVKAQRLNESLDVDPQEPIFFPRVWLGIIEAGKISLEMARNNMTLTPCQIQLGMYADGLDNKVPWAIKSEYIYFLFYFNLVLN